MLVMDTPHADVIYEIFYRHTRHMRRGIIAYAASPSSISDFIYWYWDYKFHFLSFLSCFPRSSSRKISKFLLDFAFLLFDNIHVFSFHHFAYWYWLLDDDAAGDIFHIECQPLTPHAFPHYYKNIVSHLLVMKVVSIILRYLLPCHRYVTAASAPAAFASRRDSHSLYLVIRVL